MPRFSSSGHYRARPAFTLVELLVVIAIIGILVSLLLPAVQAFSGACPCRIAGKIATNGRAFWHCVQ